MNSNNLSLSDLAISSIIFGLKSYNDSLRSFKEATINGIDLNKPDDRISLIAWLNKWGCRLNLAQNNKTSAAILDWYKRAAVTLLPKGKAIWELNDNDMSDAADIYGLLAARVAYSHARNGMTLDRTIGPTAASKILFALRPESLIPWDETMRKSFGCDGGPDSYLEFLHHIRNLSWQVRDLCIKNGFAIKEFPAQIERPESTVLEIINEYIWITVTSKCKLPSRSVLKRWSSWDQSSAL